MVLVFFFFFFFLVLVLFYFFPYLFKSCLGPVIKPTLTDYKNYMYLTEETKDQIIIAALLLSPEQLIGKVFFPLAAGNPLLKGMSNMFYSVVDASRLLSARGVGSAVFVFENRSVNISSIMVLTEKWLLDYYITPLSRESQRIRRILSLIAPHPSTQVYLYNSPPPAAYALYYPPHPQETEGSSAAQKRRRRRRAAATSSSKKSVLFCFVSVGCTANPIQHSVVTCIFKLTSMSGWVFAITHVQVILLVLANEHRINLCCTVQKVVTVKRKTSFKLTSMSGWVFAITPLTPLRQRVSFTSSIVPKLAVFPPQKLHSNGRKEGQRKSQKNITT